jgi:hypothetical protein
MDRTEIGFTRFRRFKYASRINPACVVKPAGDVCGANTDFGRIKTLYGHAAPVSIQA